MNTLSSLLYYILSREKEGMINIDTSAASGDDYDLTQALTSLGWLSDVVTSGVLGMKKLLYKMLQRSNIRQVKVEGSAFNVTASGTQWVTVPLPSDGEAIAVVGWYIFGGTNCSIYNMQLVGDGAQFALKNMSATAITGANITAYYLVVD